ncbi:conserved exported protein of unknown function [Hyphomicrobium sp. 1Nfss2.1]|uniref:hypothetical protein n=1 Tax=Hyphomicrobium sp. 1Nfss2.1 TaxID=3413936 RepID=UPI003C79D122
MRATPSIAFASVLLGTVAAFSLPADAACKKFGFTVNDYGKEGPTNDAKNLLDKHITEWATKNGVTDYSTGKKTVSCELFLDVILFDEHTCTASATVCWGPDAKKLGSQSAAAPAEESPSGAPPAPVRKAEALGTATQQAAAPASADAAAAEADVSTDAPPATDTAAVEAAPTTPVEHIAAPAEVPAAAPAVHAAPPAAPPAPSQAAAAPAAPATTGAVVETGALQAGQNFAPQDQRRATAVAPEPDRAAAAAAAASAAAAAERAAQAAETAASAAKEAAAAAVAASAASKRGATVPPLNQASGSQPGHAE